MGRGEYRVWASQNKPQQFSKAGGGGWVERLCVGVVGKAQQSCGFGGKPAPGV